MLAVSGHVFFNPPILYILHWITLRLHWITLQSTSTFSSVNRSYTAAIYANLNVSRFSFRFPSHPQRAEKRKNVTFSRTSVKKTTKTTWTIGTRPNSTKSSTKSTARRTAYFRPARSSASSSSKPSSSANTAGSGIVQTETKSVNTATPYHPVRRTKTTAERGERGTRWIATSF